jgi:hypothetical protein
MVRRLVLVVLVLGCGAGEKKDLPAGWDKAADLALTQSECDGDTSAPPAAALLLSRDAGQLRGTFEDARFRCQQSLCGYRLDEGATARVLVQPCEMNPQQVPKCGCRYTVGFDLGGVVAGSLVELHQRSDRYGATSEPLPTLVASQRAP